MGFRCGGASLRRLRGRLGVHRHSLPAVGDGRDTLHVRIGQAGSRIAGLRLRLRRRVRDCRGVVTL